MSHIYHMPGRAVSTGFHEARALDGFAAQNDYRAPDALNRDAGPGDGSHPGARLGTVRRGGRGAAVHGAPVCDRVPVGDVDVPLDDPVWVLDTTPGEHAVDLAVRAGYGALRTRRLRYLVNES